jgi:hypothetical protein
MEPVRKLFLLFSLKHCLDLSENPGFKKNSALNFLTTWLSERYMFKIRPQNIQLLE